MKNRLLFLERFLMENTDEDTGVVTGEILEAYQSQGFSVNRNIVPKDIEDLRDSGVPVACRREGHANAYYISARPFSVAELRTLIDAVSSSQFISKECSDALIGKLAGMTIEKRRSSLTARMFTADRIKTDSAEIFSAIDCVQTAIERGRKIAFQYIDYLPDKTLVLRHNKKVYVVSPIVMSWMDERYYVRCIDPEKPNHVNYRIDRMRNVKILEEDAERDPDFNPSEYATKVQQMFDDGKEPVDIVILAENRRMINIIDRFGDKIETSIVDENHFRAVVNAVPSDTLFTRLLPFRDSITIIDPPEVVEAYEQLLQSILKNLEDSKKQNFYAQI